MSQEEMQYESCRRQKEIAVQNFKNCGKNVVSVKYVQFEKNKKGYVVV